MINDDFAKQDFSKGLNLDEFFKSFDEDNSTDDQASLGDLLSQILDLIVPPELEGYRVYKIIHQDRAYYPVEGSMRSTAAGLLFADATVSENGSPNYYTIANARDAAFYWIPAAEPVELPGAQVAEFPQAA